MSLDHDISINPAMGIEDLKATAKDSLIKIVGGGQSVTVSVYDLFKYTPASKEIAIDMFGEDFYTYNPSDPFLVRKLIKSYRGGLRNLLLLREFKFDEDIDSDLIKVLSQEDCRVADVFFNHKK